MHELEEISGSRLSNVILLCHNLARHSPLNVQTKYCRRIHMKYINVQVMMEQFSDNVSYISSVYPMIHYIVDIIFW